MTIARGDHASLLERYNKLLDVRSFLSCAFDTFLFSCGLLASVLVGVPFPLWLCRSRDAAAVSLPRLLACVAVVSARHTADELAPMPAFIFIVRVFCSFRHTTRQWLRTSTATSASPSSRARRPRRSTTRCTFPICRLGLLLVWFDSALHFVLFAFALIVDCVAGIAGCSRMRPRLSRRSSKRRRFADSFRLKLRQRVRLL